MVADNQSIEIADHWPNEYQPAWDSLATAESESLFSETAFELLREAAIITTLAAGLMPVEPCERDDAILRALMVKASKLGTAIVAVSSEYGANRQLALFRELIEALATLRHLLDDCGDGTRFTAYINNSLVAEREFLKVIERHSAKRGAELPIEASMARSIQAAASAAGIDDVGAVPAKKRSAWPSGEALIEKLGGDAYLSYRAGSSVLHSQWTDLLRNHLVETPDGQFQPRFTDLPPRPQPLYAGATLLVKTIAAYLGKTRPDALEPFRAHSEGLERRLEKLVRMHGAWLDARRGPRGPE